MRPSDSTVLIAHDDQQRTAALAAVFAAEGLLPSIAFTEVQLARSLQRARFDLVLLASAMALRSPDVAGDAAVVVLDDRRLAEAVALAGPRCLVVPASAPVQHVYAAAVSLLARRNVRATPARRWGALGLDVERRTATWHDRPLSLTKLQYRLLLSLVDADGAVVSRADLEERMYGDVPVTDGDRVVSHVRRIRAKIELDPSHPEFLLSVAGEGFRLADPVETTAVAATG